MKDRKMIISMLLAFLIPFAIGGVVYVVKVDKATKEAKEGRTPAKHEYITKSEFYSQLKDEQKSKEDIEKEMDKFYTLMQSEDEKDRSLANEALNKTLEATTRSSAFQDLGMFSAREFYARTKAHIEDLELSVPIMEMQGYIQALYAQQHYTMKIAESVEFPKECSKMQNFEDLHTCAEDTRDDKIVYLMDNYYYFLNFNKDLKKPYIEYDKFYEVFEHAMNPTQKAYIQGKVMMMNGDLKSVVEGLKHFESRYYQEVELNENNAPSTLLIELIRGMEELVYKPTSYLSNDEQIQLKTIVDKKEEDTPILSEVLEKWKDETILSKEAVERILKENNITYSEDVRSTKENVEYRREQYLKEDKKKD